MNHSLFSRRSTIAIVALAAGSLLAGFAAAIFGDGASDVESVGTDSFSSSAIGHRALFDLLERSGRNVIRSRSQSGPKAGAESLLLVLEPTLDGEFDDRDATALRNMVDAASISLVVLPKWVGLVHPDHPSWIEGVEAVESATIARVATVLGISADLVRERGAPWSATLDDIEPTVHTPQFVAGAEGEAPVRSAAGAMLTRVPNTDRWVLTDPDLLSNHGLGRGDNAALVLAILDHIAPQNRTIIIDETMHGWASTPNIWAELGRFPLVLALGQALAAIGVLIWAGTARFGSPVSDATGLRPGKQLLMDNTAELLLLGGHTQSVLVRYLALVERRVAAEYNLSPGLDAAGRRDRLAPVGASRNLTHDLDSIRDAVAQVQPEGHGVEIRALRAARLVRQWHEEMANGNR